MEIIPVIDLMHGHVVHARMGQRQYYQPIQSLLCQSSTPMDMVDALLELYPFRRMYIADIDAITGQGHHASTIWQIQEKYAHLDIWLDAGISNTDNLTIWQAMNITHVIGSENIASLDHYMKISQKLEANFILSLDFNQTGFLGCTELHTNTKHWPEKVIVMALNQVGSQLGVDIDRLQSITTQAHGHQIYAAGGVRNHQDLDILKGLNITGALVATALHHKTLTPGT